MPTVTSTGTAAGNECRPGSVVAAAEPTGTTAPNVADKSPTNRAATAATAAAAAAAAAAAGKFIADRNAASAARAAARAATAAAAAEAVARKTAAEAAAKAAAAAAPPRAAEPPVLSTAEIAFAAAAKRAAAALAAAGHAEALLAPSPDPRPVTSSLQAPVSSLKPSAAPRSAEAPTSPKLSSGPPAGVAGASLGSPKQASASAAFAAVAVTPVKNQRRDEIPCWADRDDDDDLQQPNSAGAAPAGGPMAATQLGARLGGSAEPGEGGSGGSSGAADARPAAATTDSQVAA